MKLLLAQDEPGENDHIQETDGYTLVIDRDLLKLAAPLTIDSAFGRIVIRSRINAGFGACGG